MRLHVKPMTFFLILFAYHAVACAESRVPFIAYSLREACVQARAGRTTRELLGLGGLTRIGGMVYDRDSGDIILIGLAVPGQPEAGLDDLAVALRARLLYDEFPLVSIDPVEGTEKTKLQKVRFSGHLEDTPYGADFLKCDIVLKLYSLQRLKAVPSVRPYNLHLEDDIRDSVRVAGSQVVGIHWLTPEEGIKLSESHRGMAVADSASYQARFWFYVREPYNVAYKPKRESPEVFCIRELDLCVQSENILQDNLQLRDKARERFSEEMTAHFDEVCLEYPALKKLKVLYDLVAVADAIRTIKERPYLRYLLEEYRILPVRTDPNYKLQELYGFVERTDDLHHLLRISGGIELRPQTEVVELLNEGEIMQLRSVVVNSRPSPGALTWRLPLDGWRMPNTRDLKLWTVDQEGTPDGMLTGSRQGTGCSILSQSVILNPKAMAGGNAASRFSGFAPGHAPPPLRGVSMRMTVSDESFKPMKETEADALREDILKSRPSSDALSWPAPERGNKDVGERK